MRRLAVVGLICGLLLAGCGVTTTGKPAFNGTLIKQVGAGSVVIENAFVALVAEAKVSGAFTDPATQQATTYLAQGRLDKLSIGDLTRMASANRKAAAYYPQVFAKVDRLATSIAGASLPVSSYRGLADGSQRFSADWNQYLATWANSLRGIHQALAGLSPVYSEFQRLLRAAYDTAKLQSTVQFDKVRRAVFTDLGPRFTRIQSEMKSIDATGTAIEQKLVNDVNDSQDARAIASKVNETYADGFLAREFKKR